MSRRAVAGTRPHREDPRARPRGRRRRPRTWSTSTDALRPDEPRPCLAASRTCSRRRPSRSQRRLRRSEPGPGEHDRRPDRADGRRPPSAVRAGELDPGELFEAYRERAAADELNAFTWVARRRRERRRARWPARRRPGRGQGPVLHRGRPEPGRLADPRGLPAALHRDGGPAARRTPARRCSARPTRTSSRWAPRTRTPGFGPVLNPWDRGRVPGRLVGRQRGGRRRRARAVGDRHRHRWLDPPAGGAVRGRRPQADLRRVLALRHDRVRLLARPGRPADPRRDRRRAAARGRWSDATRATRPRSSSPSEIALPAARGPAGHPARRPRGADRVRGRGRGRRARRLRGRR